jgi:hypothetical protein
MSLRNQGPPAAMAAIKLYPFTAVMYTADRVLKVDLLN